MFLVHAVCFYISYAMQLFAADDFSRRHFQMIFFFLALQGLIHQLKIKHIVHVVKELSSPLRTFETYRICEQQRYRRTCASSDISYHSLIAFAKLKYLITQSKQKTSCVTIEQGRHFVSLNDKCHFYMAVAI